MEKENSGQRGKNKLKINKCKECGSYTLKEVCPNCGGEVRGSHPPKFSPEDRYGKYRRRLKKEVMELGE
ncbi:ribosome biogenesis protein [candidate division MSBL1 archaeon SCGC-AAA261G05]|uniref:Ribosome biogenesis protein Nop10 n=1 Tax=candidate division MSBL1 archaeon SCGC-AAA261G05 TaxID=1698276 RepID=A0A133V8H9_9EURY|nr:ribosome biogenesis protein [candidate division MSBL1 archaeon SCGC-AAA261G05]